MTAFTVIPGEDFEVRVRNAADDAWIVVGRITGLDIGDDTTSFSDTTDSSTTGYKTYTAGIRALDKSTFNINWEKADVGQARLLYLEANPLADGCAFEVEFSTGDVLEFSAHVETHNLSGNKNDNVIRGSFQLQNTTAITIS